MEQATLHVPFFGTFNVNTIGPESKVAGVSPIKFLSLSDITELEARTYHDVPERIKGIEKIHDFLHACKTCEQKFGTSLSYEFRDKDLNLAGFSFALIGDARETKYQAYVKPLLKFTGSTACIYLSEWIGGNHPSAAGQMFARFFRDYVQYFLSKGQLLPIVSEQRLSTSFDLIKSNVQLVDKLIERQMVKLSNPERIRIERFVGPERSLGDKYRHVLLIPKILDKTS